MLVAGGASTVDASLFPSDFKVIHDGNFELLGGPVGTPSFCNQHTQARVDKATRVLEALGELPEPQVALKLLRECAAFSKMVFSIRVVPASYHTEALRLFDAQVRAAFEQFTCLQPDDEQWAQATLSTNGGGLGLRSLTTHSQAAFLASRSSCLNLCRELDPAHVFHSSDGSAAAPERLAREAFNNSVADNARLPYDITDKLSQKVLSQAVDDFTAAGLKQEGATSTARRAHLSLVTAPGAGLWLQATPSKAAKLDNEPALFVTMLRRWLRMPFADQDVLCPCCDGVLDCFGDHALVCRCGGDRARRHNLLRN